MTIKWEPIANSLSEIYKDIDKDKNKNIFQHFKKDEVYLKSAFEFTEELWKKQLDKIEKLNTILISEAPLFEPNKSYIYNTDTAPSAFFYFNDLEAFPTYHEIKSKSKISTETKKKIILEHFAKNGFLILDIFPFALNSGSTAINYQKMKDGLYAKLLAKTADLYLKPKLELCLQKCCDKIKILYRYKKIYNKANPFLKTVLNDVFKNHSVDIDCVNSTNMPLDRSKLSKALEEFA